MKKMNILIVSESINQIGGSFVSPWRFGQFLKKRGHNIIFLTAGNPGEDKISTLEGIKIYSCRSIGFSVSPLDRLGRLALPRIKDVSEIIEKDKIDIVHIMAPTPVSLVAIKAARKHGLKVVSHSHNQPENITSQLPKFLCKNWVHSLIWDYFVWIYKKTDTTISPSLLSEKFLKIKNLKNPIFVISNGVNLSFFKKTNPISFIKKYKLNSKVKRILLVGRLDPEKNIKTLIKAIPFVYKEYKDFQVDIVGEGSIKRKLEDLSKNLGVEKNINFFGRISDKDLLLAYNACDILVQSSLIELEGMVVLEAMACGKPLVVANSPKSASIHFVEGNGLLFESKNPKDLADKLIKLLKNEGLRKKMGLKSYEIAKKYDINKSIEKLEKVYYDLLCSKKSLNINKK
jgi:glycosyltransferase involved in cell wall biosynthesis